jgi:hypothetical protein
VSKSAPATPPECLSSSSSALPAVAKTPGLKLKPTIVKKRISLGDDSDDEPKRCKASASDDADAV